MAALNGVGGPAALPTRTATAPAAPAETAAPTTNAPATTQAPGDSLELKGKPPTDEDKAAQAEGFKDAEDKKLVDQWWEKRAASQLWDRILESFKDEKK